MKKRRFFKIICCFCLLLCSTFFLTACTGGGSGGSGSGSGYDSDNPPKPDSGKQPPSSGDDSDIDIDDDGNIGGNGQVADFSDYFYGYMGMIKGNDDFEVQDEATGSKVKFNTLLDRQFDVLAQDILYRLAYVYGYNGTTHNRTNGKKYTLQNGNSAYKLNNHNAVVDSKKLLATTDNVTQLTEININDINDYQKSIITSGTNYLLNEGAFYLSGAIEGRSSELHPIGSNVFLFSLNNRPIDENNNYYLSWNWGKTLESTNIYHPNNTEYNGSLSFINTTNINNFKMALAQMISGTTVNGVYTKSEYDKLISTMDCLGYIKSSFTYTENNIEHNKIVDFIKNTIIGNNLVSVDDSYAKIIDEFGGEINDALLDKINALTFNENIDQCSHATKHKYNLKNNPRLYKGYSMVIPAIVNQALNNIFEDTITDDSPKGITLYPYYARSSSKNGDFETRKIINSSGEVVEEMTTTGPITLDKIILKPKANSQPVALQLQIATARKLNNGEQSDDINDLGCYAHDIVVELEVNITYKSGAYVLSMPTYVPDGEDSGVLTIDSKGYVPTYIDTSDPNFDPTKVKFDPNNPNAKDPYSEQFRKPYDTNGEILPFNYVFSIYDKYTDDTPKMGAYNGPSDASSMTLFNNGYKSDGSSVYLDAGDNYIQFTFNIKSVKKYSGDNSTQLVDASEYKNDVVFDISLMPFTF